MTAPDSGWAVGVHRARVADLHGLGIPEPIRREVRLCRPADAALVIGSTQLEPAPGALPVVRRRGGGGAVIVRPGELVWVDVVVPRSDPMWDDDVGRAFLWLGKVWVAALDDLGVRAARVHQGGVVCAPWCRPVCFAGLGPGEVTVGERKAVGMSQRRTRGGALFQCSLLRRWDPDDYAVALELPPEAIEPLASAAIPFPELAVEEVESAFLANLPRLRPFSR